MKVSAASFTGLVETPVCCSEKSSGTTLPSVVTPRNGSAKALSALAEVFFQPSGIGSTILLADPGRSGLTPYPPYLPGMMLIAHALLPLKFIDTPTSQAASRHYTPPTASSTTTD